MTKNIHTKPLLKCINMTEANGKNFEGVYMGQMTGAQSLKMTAEDRKVVH